VKFEYLILADSMNFTAEGKVNVLGMGWRQANLPSLPGPLSFTVVASVTVPPSQAGEYQTETCLVLPDGTEEVLSPRTAMTFQGPPDAAAIGLVLGLDVVAKPFTQAGLYRLRVTIGPISEEYEFRVAGPAAKVAASAPAASKGRRTGGRTKGSLAPSEA
jgi:hypothetical protein